MAKEPGEPETRQEARKVWLWSRANSSTEAPSNTSSTQSSSDAPAQQDPRLDASRKPPKDLPHLSEKLDPKSFQTNFPREAGGAMNHATVSDAMKTIKPEDFLSVTNTPCARDGFMGGIVSGALVGGVRFVMSAPFPKVANWAVGGGLAGAVAMFEYCQWKKRQERVMMKRAVEVYQETMSEKRMREYQEQAAAKDEAERLRAEAEAQKKKTWYRFW